MCSRLSCEVARECSSLVCCSGVQGLEPGDLIQVGDGDPAEEEEEEEEDEQPVTDEFGDLASIMTEIEASESDDSDTSEEDPDLEALLGIA
eukprot:COSAG02_NODE_3569_length_6546_cov_4.016752_4_plen_91_part_00